MVTKKPNAKPKTKRAPKGRTEPSVVGFEEWRSSRKSTIYIGIDPGSTGAIGFICPEEQEAYVLDIPMFREQKSLSRSTTKDVRAATGKKSKTILRQVSTPDYRGIIDLFTSCYRCPTVDRIVALELIPFCKGQARYGDTVLNRLYGMWGLYLFSADYKVQDIRPEAWKAYFDLLTPRGEKVDKAKSIAVALKYFPGLAPYLTRKSEDHNRAEAILIALYRAGCEFDPEPDHPGGFHPCVADTGTA